MVESLAQLPNLNRLELMMDYIDEDEDDFDEIPMRFTVEVINTLHKKAVWREKITHLALGEIDRVSTNRWVHAIEAAFPNIQVLDMAGVTLSVDFEQEQEIQSGKHVRNITNVTNDP
jgi:hypothetical protein